MDSWAEYHSKIDTMLSEHRPPRAKVSEKAWRADVYGWAKNHIPNESMLVSHFAEQTVDRREMQATKRANKYVRDYLRGVVPLEWAWLGPLPIKIGELRVRFDAATPNDVEDGAREMERRGRVTFQEMQLLVDGLRDMARAARDHGFSILAQIGDQPLKENGGDDWSDGEDDDETDL